jgi:hypothetical protein
MSEWRDGARGGVIRRNGDEVLIVGRSHFGWAEDLTAEVFEANGHWASVPGPSAASGVSSWGGWATHEGDGLLFFSGALTTDFDQFAGGDDFFYDPPNPPPRR